MSFQNKSFWMPRDAGCLTDGDISCDTSSRIELKRPHQWFMDAPEPELFCNKKQVTEAVSSGPISGILNANVSLWDNTSGFQAVSGQFSDRLFGSETVRTSNLVHRSIPTVGTGNFSMERKGFEDQIGTDSSVGLSMSRSIEDPSCISYGGIRKVKANQARESENGMSVSIGHSYSRGDNNTVTIGTAYGKTDNNISLGPTYNIEDVNTVSMGPAFNKMNENFISTGHTFNKGDGSFMLLGHNYNKGDDNVLSMGQPFDKGDGSFISMGHGYAKGNGNIISGVPSYNKGLENFISIGSGPSGYNTTSENFLSVGPSYNKGGDNIVLMRPTSDKANTNVTSSDAAYDEGNSRIPSMGLNYKGEINTISFGGFQNESETNPSSGFISDYDLLTSQPSAQTLTTPGLEDPADHAGAIGSVAPAGTSKTGATVKGKVQKPPKKVLPNNFPSNVKSLLSTGMLDGVPVKYVSWSREKNLKGVVKGTGYLCGCDNCKFSKSLNAYEFERHAGCKTKHPNNHIYFENGKTIYAVVQELKSTPQEMLFETIQNVTGSPINQKNFRIWKVSYEAATRELQRIYGKDELIMPS